MEDMLNSQDTIYIEQLKDAFYDADDVLDEFVTLVKRKKAIEASHEVIDKVRSFLYCFKPLIHNLSHKVKEVNKKLAVIAENNSKYRSTITPKPRKFIKPETSSFVYENDPIIGRDEDLEKIVEMLLNPGPNNVSSLAIVGMGGLGKTAFAQLVYNDPRITSAFPLKSWTCIADQDGWDLTQLLGKIVKELGGDNNHNFSLQQIQTEIEKKLEGKKYLLVLDDVWTENYINWKKLENPLMVGKNGSRIVVTTRSKKTANIIGGARVHELQGLSEDESWCLFERMAFQTKPRENLDEDFIKLGKDIVKKCLNVPLAIRVVGSLLRGESKPMWLSFRDKELADIGESDDTKTLNNILSLSYYQLDSSLKSCFAYCALFPKDFQIDKKELISLWMAQGYINVEILGEKNFHILLQRCFFQDIKENIVGEIKCFKIHDLLHDIAEQAAGMEVCRLTSGPFNVDRKVRHLSLLPGFCPQEAFNKTHIRTYHQILELVNYEDMSFDLNSSSDHPLVVSSIANWSSLRTLDLSHLSAKRLPESIGKLIHLRYLDLSYSYNLVVLPNSITKLVNLQTLDLYHCSNLEELPKDMWKLVDLSTLNITSCDKLSHMPSKMGMLTNLHTLGLFVVGGASSYEKKMCFDGLEDLGSLNNLKGALELRIIVDKNAKYVKEEHGGGAYLINKVHLHKIHIHFIFKEDESIEWEQALLEEMQPHAEIKVLFLEGYSGETMPRWPRREDNSTLFYFPNLVHLKFEECQQLRFFPSLEKLPHLKQLGLVGLPNVEYVVNTIIDSASLSEGASFFPCLEDIYIDDLPKLKGWWLGSWKQNEHLIGEPFPSFAQLKELYINRCPMLKSIPICSRLNSVRVNDTVRDVKIYDMNQLPSNYKCLLPAESKSRMITVSYFETFLPK